MANICARLQAIKDTKVLRLLITPWFVIWFDLGFHWLWDKSDLFGSTSYYLGWIAIETEYEKGRWR